MTLPIYASKARIPAHLAAAGVLLRASFGLFVHALTHPARHACIHRTTGRVTPR